jgi:hypothetical protein
MWIGPLVGFWFLGTFVGPALFTPSEHGSIFVLQPAFFLAGLGALVHSIWVFLSPPALLTALVPSVLIASIATFLALVGTALFWNETLFGVIEHAGPIPLGMLALSLMTAIAISKLYLGRKMKGRASMKDGSGAP